MQNYLSVSMRELEDRVVVELDGELDLASSSQFEQALTHALRDKPKLVVLDLANLRFIDMAGLRVMLAGQDQAGREGGQLALSNLPTAVRRLLKLARIDGVFTILEDAP